MRKKYIKVENIYLYILSNAEFINFMERFMALLPIEKDEESQDAVPKLSITAAQLAEGKAYLATMKDLNKKSRKRNRKRKSTACATGCLRSSWTVSNYSSTRPMPN